MARSEPLSRVNKKDVKLFDTSHPVSTAGPADGVDYFLQRWTSRPKETDIRLQLNHLLKLERDESTSKCSLVRNIFVLRTVNVFSEESTRPAKMKTPHSVERRTEGKEETAHLTCYSQPASACIAGTGCIGRTPDFL